MLKEEQSIQGNPDKMVSIRQLSPFLIIGISFTIFVNIELDTIAHNSKHGKYANKFEKEDIKKFLIG